VLHIKDQATVDPRVCSRGAQLSSSSFWMGSVLSIHMTPASTLVALALLALELPYGAIYNLQRGHIHSRSCVGQSAEAGCVSERERLAFDELVSFTDPAAQAREAADCRGVRLPASQFVVASPSIASRLLMRTDAAVALRT
jgi:hypothetical protein